MESSIKSIKKEIKIFHPFAFIIFEIINIYLTVNETASMDYIIRPIIILLIFVFLFYKLLIFFLKNKYKSAIISTTTVVFIFSFFYFYQFFSKAIKASPGLVFIPIWILIYLFIVFITLKSKIDLKKTNRTLNLISIFVLFSTLCFTLFLEFKITNYDLSDIFKNKWINEDKNNNKKNQYLTNTSYINKNDWISKKKKIEKQKLPDIYYIILDSYARQDVLKHIYKFDNQPFINYLKKKGFYIADKSKSNYNLTYFSLASSLNSDYINNLTYILGENSKRLRLPISLLQKNRVVKFLKKKGYEAITFDSTLAGTYLKESDKKKGPFFCFTEFETIISKVSIFSFIFNKTLYSSHYNFINYTLNNLSKINNTKLPKFVFAHILSPHPPFIFKADGKIKALNYSFNFFDGFRFLSPKKTYKMYLDGYKSQVQYINHKLKIIIDEIIKNTKTPPIIILQGDHGPRSSYHSGDINKPVMQERFSILNAILLPEKAKHLLYKGISPVNTFRIILNHLFNTKLPLLQDLHFFSKWTKLFKFNKVFIK